jgi:carboxyl-terminal processing protease
MEFVYLFNAKLYSQLKLSGKSSNYIKWRSAAFLVDKLKAQDDIFSKFFPPKDAKKFEGEVLGKRIDLGIEGAITSEGFVIKWIEPRSDAYEKGVRGKDIILSINDRDVTTLAQEEIDKLLQPLEGESVKIRYYSLAEGLEKFVEPLSKEYFKQTVFMVPVGVPDVYCIQIQRFNRMAGEDMEKLMAEVIANKNSSLIIDLRGNPGGPPLAAREISAFFLPANEEFAYFQRKNAPRSSLFVPEITEDKRYHGDMAILVNEKSGSASELFSGILQRRGRAILIGKNTAGQVF